MMLRQGLHPKVVADRLGDSTTRLSLDVHSHVLPSLESEAEIKVGDAIREAIGQRLISISTPAAVAAGNENAAIPCGVNVSDGGHESSRTSDPYSVHVVQAQSTLVHQCPSASI
jgi:hypothetical protein